MVAGRNLLAAVAGSLGCVCVREREMRRGKERREEEERVTRRFKYLSYANRTGATKSRHLL
jgi:hypothetical protein